MPRRRFRDPDPQVRDRNKWDATGQPAVGGLSRIGGAGAARPSVSIRSGPSGGQVRIDHVTLHGTASQTISNGGGSVVWNRYDAAPNQINGFGDLQDELSLSGEVEDVPVNLTGLCLVVYRREFSSYQQDGTLTLRITRDGTEFDLDIPMGPPATRLFYEATTVWVEAGDTVTVVEPNDSGSGQTVSSARLDLTVWEHAPAASTVPQPSVATLITSTSATDSDGDVAVAVPAEAETGDLLLVVCSPSAQNNGDHTWTGPAGFTDGPAIAAAAAGDGVSLASFTRVVDGNESGSYTFTIDGASIGVIATVLVIRGGTTVVSDSDSGFEQTSLTVGPVGGGSDVWFVAAVGQGATPTLSGATQISSVTIFRLWQVTSDTAQTVTGLSGGTGNDAAVMMLGVGD